jgi:type IV secretory pathway VirB2 component (pilin)
MDYLRGPLYLDVASKGLCLAGVMMMIFGQGGWFAAGVVAVVVGVLFGAWSMVAGRRMRGKGTDPQQQHRMPKAGT